MWVKVLVFVKVKYPHKYANGRATAVFKDTFPAHFRSNLKGGKKQKSLDRFVMKLPVVESDESGANRKGILKNKIKKGVRKN